MVLLPLTNLFVRFISFQTLLRILETRCIMLIIKKKNLKNIILNVYFEWNDVLEKSSIHCRHSLFPTPTAVPSILNMYIQIDGSTFQSFLGQPTANGNRGKMNKISHI